MAQATPPLVLPWALVLKFVLAGSAIVVPAVFYSGGAAGAVAAIAGLAPSLFGALLSSRRDGALAGAAVIAALSLETLINTPMTSWVVALAFAVSAGAEATLTGGRAMIMALYAWLVLTLLPNAPPPDLALPVVVIAVAWGSAAVWTLGLAGLAAGPPAPKGFGIGMSVFLISGLLLTGWLMARSEEPYAYWLALLFTFRAIAPAGQTIASALKFGAGAVLGSLLALLLSFVSLPSFAAWLLSAVLATLGLRYLPNPRPWSATAFTSAVLISVATGAHNAVFRLEAAMTVVVMTCALVLLIGGAWQLLTGRRPGTQA